MSSTPITNPVTPASPRRQSGVAGPRQVRMLEALSQRSFFKLICGGSFTDTTKTEALAAIYAEAGVHCIDISPDPDVLSAVAKGLAHLPETAPRPAVMVSLPLDPDPHFRKIDLVKDACILCDGCIPVCPTDAIASIPDAASGKPVELAISQPLCYGCGRCVAVCPTDALILHPFEQTPEKLSAVLARPSTDITVDAVEIHTRYADPYMLPAFLETWHDLLSGKILSVCFRPDTVDPEQWLAFLEALERFNRRINPHLPLLIQIDGDPMSGSDAMHSSQNALAAARRFYEITGERFQPITISGGINAHTAEALKQPEHAFLAGVGMGTVARKFIWDALENPTQWPAAIQQATTLVRSFCKN